MTSEALTRAWSEVADHYNDHHPDTVLFVANHALSRTDLTSAEIIEIGSEAVQFRVKSDGGEPAIESFTLPQPLTRLEGLAQTLIGLLHQARQAAPEGVPLTSIEVEFAKTASLATHTVTVKTVTDINAHLREITFCDIGELQPPGGDAFMFLFVPNPGEDLPAGYDMARWRGEPADERLGGAYYTIRRSRPDEVDMWFVLHETWGAVSAWAGSAQPGDQVAMWGPRVGFEPPDGTRQYVLLADETALAAVAAVLDELPADVAVTTIAEVNSTADHVPLRQEPGWNLHWVYRNGAEPGTSDAMLQTLPVPPTEGLYVFGAAEASQIGSVRSHVRQAWSPDRGSIHLTGYWRRGVSK